jgi:hypothetical protein
MSGHIRKSVTALVAVALLGIVPARPAAAAQIESPVDTAITMHTLHLSGGYTVDAFVERFAVLKHVWACTSASHVSAQTSSTRTVTSEFACADPTRISYSFTTNWAAAANGTVPSIVEVSHDVWDEYAQGWNTTSNTFTSSTLSIDVRPQAVGRTKPSVEPSLEFWFFLIPVAGGTTALSRDAVISGSIHFNGLGLTVPLSRVPGVMTQQASV